jgi:hypothetical protein
LEDNKDLDFGDVFYSEEDKQYYMCITALCDCLRPSNTDFIFYFAKGEPINIERAILLGDSAFVSFISKDKAITWSRPAQTPSLDVDNHKDEEDKVIKELKNKVDDLEYKVKHLEAFKYKPIYIKPLSYLVENPVISNGELELARIFQYEKNKGDLKFESLKYVTTIKPSYAQRISNHAFSHPVRVGVDFAKN